MVKKVYLTPKAENVVLIAGPIMNIVEGSNTQTGTGSGSSGDEDPEVATPSRGEWGNLWK